MSDADIKLGVKYSNDYPALAPATRVAKSARRFLTSPTTMDPFEVRMQFLGLLKRLNA